jgi:hypothetical protein
MTTVRVFTINMHVKARPPLPYLGRDLLQCSPDRADMSDPDIANQHTLAVVVQVEAGKRVHAELTPDGQELRVADIGSPVIEGNVELAFGPGWVISVLEAE